MRQYQVEVYWALADGTTRTEIFGPAPHFSVQRFDSGTVLISLYDKKRRPVQCVSYDRAARVLTSRVKKGKRK